MKLTLREVTGKDIDLLFRWANDPLTRQNAFHTEPIPYEENQKWFYGLMKDEKRVQYIFMEENIPVGQIRFTIEGDEAVIGYSIASGMRGKGYGRKLLSLAQEEFFASYPMVKKLIGQVKKENMASKKCFTDSGFEEVFTQFELCNHR